MVCKICSRCKIEKPKTEFPKNGANALYSYCGECANKKGILIRNKLKLEVVSYYSPNICCVKCQEPDIRVLTIDHINGGGKKHFEKVGYGTAFYYWIKKQGYPEGFQVLCFNCQLEKRIKNREDKGGSSIHENLPDISGHNNKYYRNMYNKIKMKVISHYCPTLTCVCGYNRVLALTIDHINNDGKSHRKMVSTGRSYYSWFIRNDYPKNYQILCMNCNWRRRYEP